MPAVALAEANTLIGASRGAWTTLLYPAHVAVAPLDSSQAIRPSLELQKAAG
jgi:hypothetical protein